MAKRQTRLEKILSLLFIDEKKLCEMMGVNSARLNQLRKNPKIPQDDVKLEKAIEYVKSVWEWATKIEKGDYVVSSSKVATETPVIDELEVLRGQYETIFGKKVANVKKNDAEWIRNKIEWSLQE